MLWNVDIERRFTDIKTIVVDAPTVQEAKEIAIKVANKSNWGWPNEPSFSVMYSESVTGDTDEQKA